MEALNWKITNTDMDDLDEACEMFDDAIAYQKGKNVPQYVTNDRARVAKMIKERMHYKMVIDGEIACVFGTSLEEKIVWRHRERGDAIYLNKIITKQKFKGLQLLKYVVKWAVEYAIQLDRSYVRLDTWNDNASLKSYYEKFGFAIVEPFLMPTDERLSPNCWGGRAVLMEIDVNEHI